MPRGHRRKGQVGRPRFRRRAHPLRRRGPAGSRPSRIGAPRCDHGAVGHVLPVDGLRRRRRRRRPVQPRRGGAPRVRPGRSTGQDLVNARGVRASNRQPATRPECQFAAGSFGSSHRGARSGARHHPRRAARPTPNSTDGGPARRRTRRRDAGHVRDGRSDRQARRRPLPLSRAARRRSRHGANAASSSRSCANAAGSCKARPMSPRPSRGCCSSSRAARCWGCARRFG